MIVEKILIIDQQNGEAGEYTFSSGANLLVSQKNSQGKSSLLKTLYFGLGLSIKTLPLKWYPKKLIIKINVFNERTNEKLYIIRDNELFYVSDNNEPLNLSEYTKWLSEKLGVDMKLTLSKTKMTRSISYPSALITPFYVDQDESWSNKFFSANNEVQMYSNVPKSIFDYVLNITDDEKLKAKEELLRLGSQRKTLENKRKNINDVYMDYIETDEGEPPHDITDLASPELNNNKNIDMFIKLMDEANKRYIQHKANRIKLQRELDQLKKTYEEYQSIFKMLNADYEYIKSVCKHCNSELTAEQVRTRMDISTDLFEINHLIAATKHELKKKEEQIVNSLTLEEESSKEYGKLSKEVDTNTEIKSIADYIEAASKKKSHEEFATIISNLDTAIGQLTYEIKEKQKEIREAVVKAKELVGKISHSYSEYVNELSILIKGSNVNDIEFENFSAPKSSGVNVNQTYLGIYLAYMRLTSEYGRYRLPFCIDSFVKNEISDATLKDMFKATETYLLKMEGQTIFSAIEESVTKYMEESEKFHRVSIGDRLLTKANFDKNIEEIKKVIISS